MLVITRHYGERLVMRCGEHEVSLYVRELHGSQIKLCIEGPEQIEVIREELQKLDRQSG